MPDYVVHWAIDAEDVDDVEEAAQFARDALLRPGSIAHVFEVREGDMSITVDLNDGEVGNRTWVPDTNAIADLAQWMFVEENWGIDEVVEMIRRPHKYADEYSKMIVERAFDEVALEPEEEDTDSTETTTEGES
jgi:hypothetical protein